MRQRSTANASCVPNRRSAEIVSAADDVDQSRQSPDLFSGRKAGRPEPVPKRLQTRRRHRLALNPLHDQREYVKFLLSRFDAMRHMVSRMSKAQSQEELNAKREEQRIGRRSRPEPLNDQRDRNGGRDGQDNARPRLRELRRSHRPRPQVFSSDGRIQFGTNDCQLLTQIELWSQLRDGGLTIDDGLGVSRPLEPRRQDILASARARGDQ
jgi:hypothetical protein